MAKKKKKLFIGIDLGGTKMLVLLLNKRFDVLARYKTRVEPDSGAKNLIQDIAEGVRETLEDARVDLRDIRAAGIGCPGMVDAAHGVVRLAPNLPLLNRYPLGPALKRILRIPVVIENDVNAGLYGEYRLGAAKGYSHVVGIFPGTGIGGGLILNGALYRGATGGAGEIGHIFMNLEGPLSGRREDTLEGLVGRLSIAGEAAVLALRQKAPKLYKLSGANVAKIKSGVLKAAIKGGDLAIQELIQNKARILGVAMANAVNILNPELIVLGGGLIEALGNIIIKESRKTMKQMALPPLVKGVKVVEAELKDDAVAMGAAKLAEAAFSSS